MTGHRGARRPAAYPTKVPARGDWPKLALVSCVVCGYTIDTNCDGARATVTDIDGEAFFIHRECLTAGEKGGAAVQFCRECDAYYDVRHGCPADLREKERERILGPSDLDDAAQGITLSASPGSPVVISMRDDLGSYRARGSTLREAIAALVDMAKTSATVAEAARAERDGQ